MAKVMFVEPSGSERVVDVPDGFTLMQAATINGIDGIDGECGGACACATCHCYIDQAALGKVTPPSETELAMLENVAAELEPGSRLACQIKVHPGLNGLVVRLPDQQS